jgi:hypothetical protein
VDEATRIAKLREERETLKKRLSGQSKPVTREMSARICACAWTYVSVYIVMKSHGVLFIIHACVRACWNFTAEAQTKACHVTG